MTGPAAWTTSSYSGEQGNCVEVKLAPEVAVRDTKAREAGTLSVSAAGWSAFLAAVAAN